MESCDPRPWIHDPDAPHKLRMWSQFSSHQGPAETQKKKKKKKKKKLQIDLSQQQDLHRKQAEEEEELTDRFIAAGRPS